MSVRVELDGLVEQIGRFGPRAYLVSVDDGGAPHVVSVVVERVGDHLVVGAGRRTRANVEANPVVTLLWPPGPDPAYSLLVDGRVAGEVDDGERLALEATSAVLHRVAGVEGDGPTCVPVT